MSAPDRPLIQDAPRLALLSLAALLVLAPYIWMLAVSIKPQEEVFKASLSLWPQNPAMAQNYGKVLSTIPVGAYLRNGLIVCFGILIFQILFAAPAAYALAKLRFRGRDIIFGFVMLGARPLPDDRAAALSRLPQGGSPQQLQRPDRAIRLLRLRDLPVPPVLQGHSRRPHQRGAHRRHERILDRLARRHAERLAAATAFAIFSVVAHWNDLFWPLIVIQKGDLYTPAMGILAFRAVESGEDYGALMAAAVLITAPLVLAFLFAQRRFIEGITMTGLKG